MSTRMIQGVAEAGAVAVALQLLRVATLMAALTEARITGVAVGSVLEAVSEVVVVVMLAGPRDIGAGAVELLHWRTYSKLGIEIHSFPFGDFLNFPGYQ